MLAVFFVTQSKTHKKMTLGCMATVVFM